MSKDTLVAVCGEACAKNSVLRSEAGGKQSLVRGLRKTVGKALISGLLAIGSMFLFATDASAALSASVTLLTGDPTSIYPGQTTRLQITLSNSNTGSAVNGVAFSNSLPGVLPNGLEIAGAATYSCTDPATSITSDPGTETLTAVNGTQAIALSGGIIPANANNTDGACTILVPVTAGTSTGSTATYTYTIASGAVTGNDGSAISNGGAVSQSINVNALAKPSISKSFAASTLYLGGSSTVLTVTLTNTNPTPITNFSITDAFPQLGGSAIIKVAAVPGVTASCNNGGTAPGFTAAAGDTSITATGTIPAKSGSTNGICTLTVNVEGAQTNGAYTTGAQTNSINAATQFSNDLGIPAAANATANVTVTSPLGVNKAFAHASLSDGQSDVLTITLSNSSTTPLTVNSFTDSPIDGITGTAYGLVATSGSTTCSGGTVTLVSGGDGVNLAGGTIPAGGSCTVTVNFTGTVQTAGVPITYINTIAAGAVDVGNTAIVSQSKSASILVADDLRVLKTATPATAAPGNPVKYTVTVQNYSTSALSNVTVTDHLSNGMTFLTGTINGNDYTPTLSGTGCTGLSVAGAVGATTPVFTIGTVPARVDQNNPSACVINFYAMTSTSAINSSSTANTINAGDVCYNAGSTCNGGGSGTTTGTVNTTVLSATKLFDGVTSVTHAEGTISTLKITLTNNSANPLTNASISDSLPTDASGGQLRIANPANAASTCGTPTITAVADSTSVSFNGGTVPARASNGTGAAGTCFLQVDVIGPAGTYPNTATVAATETYADGTTQAVGPLTSSTATLTYTSSLSASKSFNPVSVSSGGISTVTVRLNNTGAAALSNVSVTDPLPAGMVLAPAPHAYTTCSGTTAVTAAAGASTANMSGASIAGGGSCDFLFDVVATGSSNWTNTIPAGNITANGGVRNVLPVTATLTYNAPTSLSVAKATNPSTLTFPGQVSQLTITVTNGTLAVTNLHLTDYFTTDGTAAAAANGMVISPTPAAATTCPGGIVAATPGGTSVSVSGVALAASAACTVTVNVTSTAVGGITNYIPVGGIVTDQGLTNSGQASTSLATQSNIGVVKQFTPNVVQPGQRSRLRITFYNPTNLPMSNLAVTDTLPTGVTVPSGANPVTTCTGASVSAPTSGQVQVSGGTIAAAVNGVSASCYAEIDVLVATQGDYVNTIPGGGVTATSGGTAVSNSQPTSDTLRAKSPLTIHKAIAGKTLDTGNPDGFTTGSASSTPGSAATLTIRIDNPNSSALTAAAFTDTLPAGLVVAQTPGAATTCSGGTVVAAASATSIRLSGGTIPANGYCTVTVNVLSNISGTYDNTIPAAAVTTYEGVSNAEPTGAELIVSNPPSVEKQFAPAVIPPNGKSTLTIYLQNSNTSAITLTSAFTDTLPTAPGSIAVASPNGLSTTCPGTVTAAAGSGSVSYANGSPIPAGGCSISVDVTGSVAGNYTNTIPAGALQTSLGNNQQPANATLTISTLGYVSGKVFDDNNVTPNGTYQSATDTPIAGVSLELRSGANCSGTLVGTTTTDTLGNYLFSALAAGTYSVCEPVQPTATVNGITTAGTITTTNGSSGTAGTASNPTATSSQIAGIVLNGDGAGGEISGSANNNFAEVVQSGISGTVYLDQNNNGVQNGADTGIAGVAIQLLDNTSAVIASTTTDAGGNYSFTGLNPGTYSIREPNQPSATANGITSAGTVANGGTAGTATGVTVVPSQIGSIVLPPNTSATGNNFAEIPNGRTLSGQVFLDYNNNGVVNSPTDHGIGSQTVNLTGNDINGNPVNLSVTTASDGSYSFTAVPEGSSYTVSQSSQPNGTTNGMTTAGSTGGTASNPTASTSQIAGINLAGANTVSAANNFAEIPGAASDLTITKTHSPASFGEGSSTGYYTITPSNLGLLATSGTVTVVDTMPAGITPTAASGTGWTCSISGQVVTCNTGNIIGAGATGNVIILHVAVANGLAGQVLTNTAVISGGGEPVGFDGNNTATDPTSIATTASVQGTVWRDTNHNRVLDSGEAKVSGWTVQLLLGGNLVATAITDSNGAYAMTGVAPGSGYQIRFVEPTTGTIYGVPVPNETGAAYTNGVVSSGNPAGADVTGGTLTNLTLASGTNTVQQSLPLDPSGVVYDAVTRNPVSGAVVTIGGPAGFTAADVVGGSLTQTTGSNGYYQFLLLSTAPAGTYTLTVTTYPSGYVPLPSTLIPVCSNTLTVTATPDPALVQNSNLAPAAGVGNQNPAACPVTSSALASGAGTTQYYASFNLDPALPSANVVNNHIPLDPVLGGAIVVTKTTPFVSVTKGDLVPYTITATNTLSATLTSIDVRDQIPPGFKYRSGSATLNGVHVEPTVVGRNLTWTNQSFAAAEKKTYKLVLVVGSGVSEGVYVNTAVALNSLVNTSVSNVASASVRVVPDPTFDCSDLIGKVFDDYNANGYQDQGEPGIPNVRVATVRGLLITTDAEGRFHIACADIPQADHGSNFIMKLDERTLPSGYRLTTENPRIVRTTRGKMVKLNFGATIHKVFRLELDGRAFAASADDLLPEWEARLKLLVPQLKERPSVLRLAYRLQAGEPPDQAARRMQLLENKIKALYAQEKEGVPPLLIETETVGGKGVEK
ncbi:MAG: SdrD B-like domain-containing protein [Sulfuriferula sp.]|nr:SdrD B-like domain-containing protein [Sulfuriferula sp.]